MRKLVNFSEIEFWACDTCLLPKFYIKLYTFWQVTYLYCLCSQVIKLLFCSQILGSRVRKIRCYLSSYHNPQITTSPPCNNKLLLNGRDFTLISKYAMLCQVCRNYIRISNNSWTLSTHKYLPLSKINRDVHFINVGEFPYLCWTHFILSIFLFFLLGPWLIYFN